MEAWFSTFSANRCDWISISCSETCWNYWLFCTLRTPNTASAYFTVKTKAYNVIISHVVQLWLLFQILFPFVWILLLSSTTSLQSLARFLWATRYFMYYPALLVKHIQQMHKIYLRFILLALTKIMHQNWIFFLMVVDEYRGSNSC